MKRSAILAVAACAAVYSWVVMASAVYCSLANKIDLFVFPFTQWIEVAPWWRTNWFLTLLVTVSAAAPTMPAIASAFVIYKFGLARRRPLYGSTDWAAPAAIERSGLNLTRKPPA